jgi:hypothetical protein
VASSAPPRPIRSPGSYRQEPDMTVGLSSLDKPG